MWSIWPVLVTMWVSDDDKVKISRSVKFSHYHCKDSLLYLFYCHTLGLQLEGFAKDSIMHGDVIYKPAQGELRIVTSFTAQVQTISIPGHMEVGSSPVMFCGTNKAISKLTKINWKIGKETGGVKALNPPYLKENEAAEVVFTLTTPIFLKPFNMDEGLFCRLAFLDGRTTVMVGKVTSVAMTTHTSVECGVLKPFVPQVLESVTNGMGAVNIIKAAAAASDSGKLMTKQVIVADHGQPVSQLYPAVVDHNKAGLPGGRVAKSKLWCLCCINRWWLSNKAVEGVNDSPLLVTCAGWDNEEDVKLLD